MEVGKLEHFFGIPYVNRPDLLDRAVNSIREFWTETFIIDNSESGLEPARWPVKVIRPPAPLTFSQTMNLLQDLAFENGCSYFLSMHNDAEADPGTPDRLFALIDQLASERRCWGVVFTNYDALAAFSTPMTRLVGRWDTTLPQYFADNDYYRRVRLHGYETIATDFQVAHHNNASSTIKSDPQLGYINGITLGLYREYYSAKWGGPPGGERYDWEFNGELAVRFVNYLRDQDLYRQLAAAYETVEGTLLERADQRTTAAQIQAVRHAVRATRPDKIVETGTGKSFFGYVLSNLTSGVTLYTFDGDPRCAAGVDLLNSAQDRVKSVFTLGDTIESLPGLDAGAIGLAWIDGGRGETTALSDLEQMMKRRVPLILCDDSRTMPEVAGAIRRALEAEPEYEQVKNPFYDYDTRGITWLRLRQ